MSTKIRVAVIDDHRIFREGLIEILRTLDGVEVVASGASGADAVEIVRTAEPDVLVLDLDMPDPIVDELAGLRAVEAIRAHDPAPQILVLTMHDDPKAVLGALEAGVHGFLVKSAGRLELQAAITSAVRNPDTVLFSIPRTTARILMRPSALGTQEAALTERELEVLKRLAANGESNRVIAEDLHIAEATVKRHLFAVYEKLGVRTRTQAVREAQIRGLIDHR